MTVTRFLLVFGLVLALPSVQARKDDGFNEDGEEKDVEVIEKPNGDLEEADTVADQAEEQISGPQRPSQPGEQTNNPKMIQTSAVQPAAPAPAAVSAANAKQAASAARQAAKVANKVAEHSIKVTSHAKKALHHARQALHDARVESKDLNKEQRRSLKKAEGHLKEATAKAEYGELKKVKGSKDVQKENMQKNLAKQEGTSEREQMKREIKAIRRELKRKNINDPDIEKALDDLEAELDSSNGPVNDESKAELDRIRQEVDAMDAQEAQAEATEAEDENAEENVDVTPVQEKGLDIDTQMPYGDLEPFGREDTAQELTEASIRESDGMVDQLERAEVAEEKRAVFRALTRLRGAAITSFDGVARSQTGNIDEYNKVHKWRSTHPLHHLADEESDVSKWAFPENAD